MSKQSEPKNNSCNSKPKLFRLNLRKSLIFSKKTSLWSQTSKLSNNRWLKFLRTPKLLKRAIFWRMKFRIKLSSKKRRKKWARSRKNLWLSLPWLKNPNKFSSWCPAFRKHLARNKSRQNYFSEALVMGSHLKFSISSVIIRELCSHWLKQARASYVVDLVL